MVRETTPLLELYLGVYTATFVIVSRLPGPHSRCCFGGIWSIQWWHCHQDPGPPAELLVRLHHTNGYSADITRLSTVLTAMSNTLAVFLILSLLSCLLELEPGWLSNTLAVFFILLLLSFLLAWAGARMGYKSPSSPPRGGSSSNTLAVFLLLPLLAYLLEPSLTPWQYLSIIFWVMEWNTQEWNQVHHPRGFLLCWSRMCLAEVPHSASCRGCLKE